MSGKAKRSSVLTLYKSDQIQGDFWLGLLQWSQLEFVCCLSAAIDDGLSRLKSVLHGHGKEGEKATTQKTTQKTKNTTQKILELLREGPQTSRRQIAESAGDITEAGQKEQPFSFCG